MLRLGEGDARGRLKERGGQAWIDSRTYGKILSLHQKAEMDKTGSTKLTGNEAPEKPKIKGPSFLKSRPGAQEKVEKSGLRTLEAADELTREPIDLHESYGETRVVLIPVEPYMVHVYWEVASDELEKAKDRLDDNDGRSQTILRFYDVSNIFFDGTNAHSFFDVPIELESRSRYVHLWSPDKSYFVELGLKTADDRFFPLVRSNVAKTPSAWPAPKADQRDTAVHGNPEEGLSKAVVHEDPCVDATVKAGNTERQVRPQKEQVPRHQGEMAREIDSAQTLPTKLVGGREFETRRKPSFQPAPSLKEKVQGQSEKGVDVDITEMNEKAFALGVSSERGASPQKKKDSADG